MTDPHAADPGPYVLGAMAPAERAAFEEHLPTCTACRAQVEELAGLPGLLARLTLPDALALGDADPSDRAAGPLPATLLPSLLRAARRERRRRRWVEGAGAAVAVCALVAAVLTGGRLVADPAPAAGGSTAAPTPAATPTATAAPSAGADEVRTMQPLVATAISATIELHPVRWGTQVRLRCSYDARTSAPAPPAPPAPTATSAPATGSTADDDEGVAYTLTVTDRSGRRQSIGTWVSLPGREVALAGATSLARSAIASVEVVRGTPADSGSAVLALDETS